MVSMLEPQVMKEVGKIVEFDGSSRFITIVAM